MYPCNLRYGNTSIQLPKGKDTKYDSGLVPEMNEASIRKRETKRNKGK